MAKEPRPTQVVTGKARASYVFLTQPNAKGKYTVQILIPKTDTTTLKRVSAAIEAAKAVGLKKNTWNSKVVPEGLKLCIRDGDANLKSGEKTDVIYEGVYFINASSKNAPGLFDKQLNKIVDGAEIYSGMFAQFDLNLYPYSVDGNKGIAAGLNNVQKVADGERLAGGGQTSDAFSKYEDNDGEEDIKF